MLVNIPEVDQQKHEWEAHDDCMEHMTFGATPTEAVARLWLVLNKKI